MHTKTWGLCSRCINFNHSRQLLIDYGIEGSIEDIDNDMMTLEYLWLKHKRRTFCLLDL